MARAITRLLLFGLISLFLISGISANAQTESVIYSFTDGKDDGAVPVNGLTFQNGSIFGVTNEGGGYNVYGVLFQLSPNGDGGWSGLSDHASAFFVVGH